MSDGAALLPREAELKPGAWGDSVLGRAVGVQQRLSWKPRAPTAVSRGGETPPQSSQRGWDELTSAVAPFSPSMRSWVWIPNWMRKSQIWGSAGLLRPGWLPRTVAHSPPISCGCSDGHKKRDASVLELLSLDLSSIAAFPCIPHPTNSLLFPPITLAWYFHVLRVAATAVEPCSLTRAPLCHGSSKQNSTHGPQQSWKMTEISSVCFVPYPLDGPSWFRTPALPSPQLEGALSVLFVKTCACVLLPLQWFCSGCGLAGFFNHFMLILIVCLYNSLGLM